MTGDAAPSRLYEAAFPFAEDVLALPVEDIDRAAEWYAARFGLTEVERRTAPCPTVIMERDGVRIGFAVNGGDPSQEGAAILVSDIHKARDDLETKGVRTANWRVDERDGKKYQVFFVVAPDGLCYYFHQPVDPARGSGGLASVPDREAPPMISLNLPLFSLGRRPSPPGALERTGAVSFDRPLSPAFFAAFTFAALAFGLVSAWLYATGAAVPSLLWAAPPAGPGPASWSRAAAAPLLTSSGLAVAAAFVVWAVAFVFGDRSRSAALVQGTALGALGGVALAALGF